MYDVNDASPFTDSKCNGTQENMRRNVYEALGPDRSTMMMVEQVAVARMSSLVFVARQR